MLKEQLQKPESKYSIQIAGSGHRVIVSGKSVNLTEGQYCSLITLATQTERVVPWSEIDQSLNGFVKKANRAADSYTYSMRRKLVPLTGKDILRNKRAYGIQLNAKIYLGEGEIYEQNNDNLLNPEPESIEITETNINQFVDKNRIDPGDIRKYSIFWIGNGYRVIINNQDFLLTERERELLFLFAIQPGTVISSLEISYDIWPQENPYSEYERNHPKRKAYDNWRKMLTKKLVWQIRHRFSAQCENDIVESIRGGYRLNANVFLGHKPRS